MFVFILATTYLLDIKSTYLNIILQYIIKYYEMKHTFGNIQNTGKIGVYDARITIKRKLARSQEFSYFLFGHTMS